jgi:hypothetical protein
MGEIAEASQSTAAGVEVPAPLGLVVAGQLSVGLEVVAAEGRLWILGVLTLELRLQLIFKKDTYVVIGGTVGQRKVERVWLWRESSRSGV